MNQPYYLAYETRYRTVYDAGAERWGHSPEDKELYATLQAWVCENQLVGKSIIEFACGEGASGVILSALGCHYYGVDISPSAVAKAREALAPYPHARVEVLDMVKNQPDGTYDGALDSMGFHMLITDGDRKAYLHHAITSLRAGAPMLFYKESYRANGDELIQSPVDSYEDWLQRTGNDYQTPSLRKVDMGTGEIEVLLPLLPARANDRDGYVAEMEGAGFTVERFVEMNPSASIQYAASVYVRKP